MPDATAELETAAADIALTRPAREVLDRAAAAASRRGSEQIDPVDVLAAITTSNGSLAEKTMRTLNADPRAITAALPPPAPGGLPLRQLLVNANREAQVLGHYQVDSIHLLLALLYSDSPATSSALQKAGLTLYDLRRHLQMGALPSTPISARPARVQPLDTQLRRRPWPRLRGVLGVSPVFLGLLAAAAVSGGALWYGALPQGTFILSIVFVTAAYTASVCLHEFGHALVAYLGGDNSVATNGYLSLNPLRYSHPVYSIVLPLAFLLLGGIALPGGAVYVDRAALRSRRWDSAVSVAGPAAQVMCAAIVAAPFLYPGHEAWVTSQTVGFFAALGALGFFLAMSVVLNLVPIPPLDGFGIIRPWLPYSLQSAAAQFASASVLLIFLVLWTVPPVRDAFYTFVFQITQVMGIDPALVYLGLSRMRPF